MNSSLHRRHFLAVTGTSTAAMTLAGDWWRHGPRLDRDQRPGAPVAHDAATPVCAFLSAR